MSNWQPKIMVFLCQWSLKADRDWEQRFELPSGVHVVEVPCSGRINPLLLMSALQYGADGVLIVGCEPGHCHYREGNYVGRRKFATLKQFLTYLGMEDERVQVAWLKETDGGRLNSLLHGLISRVEALGPGRELALRATIPCVVRT